MRDEKVRIRAGVSTYSEETWRIDVILFCN